MPDSIPNRESGSPALRMALDYAPLLVFFLVYYLAPAEPSRKFVTIFISSLSAKKAVEALLISRIIIATAAFVVATILAMIVSKFKLGRISPMLWISGGLVVVFGGLTIYFADERFIQMKPTFVYGIFAAVLGFGLLMGRPLLEGLLGTAYPGLTAVGWRKLTINWMLFFIALGIANEIARQALTFGEWLLFKFPGCAIITVLFGVANVPMLLRHGLTLDENGAATDQLPPE